MLTLDLFTRYQWPYLAGFCLLCLLLLYRFRPAERRNVGLTALYLLLGTAGLLLGDWMVKQAMQPTGTIVVEVFAILLGMVVIRLSGLTFFRLLLGVFRFDPPRILEDVVVSIGYLVWGLVRLRYAGLDLSQLVTTSAVITAVVAFAMQDTLGNILSGIALQLDDSLDLGQWVKVNDQSGKVLQIGWRSTLIETRNGEIVVMPNGWLMKNSFQVIGKRFGHAPLQWRRWVWVEVAWDHPPSVVIGLLEQTVCEAGIAGVSLNPSPQAVLMEAKDGLARYALRYWLTDFAQDDPTDSQVRAHLITALVRHGIPLAAASHNILMTKDNDKTASLRQAAELARREKALASVPLFADFTREERHHLAEQLSFVPFEKGDVISRQGAVAHWLYILTDGEVAVWHDFGSPDAKPLGHLSRGSFFGEMGLMTGAARSATVVAVQYSECYRLDRVSFEAILQARPALAETISHVLAERLASNALPTDDTKAHQPAPPQAELLARIKRFFGL